MFIFYALLLMFVSHFFAGQRFLVVILDRLFFIWKTRKVVTGRVRQVVVLHSNNRMGICLDGPSIAHLGQVVVLQRWLFEQV